MSNQNQQPETQPVQLLFSAGETLAWFSRVSWDRSRPEQELRASVEDYKGSRYVQLMMLEKQPGDTKFRYTNQKVTIRIAEATKIAEQLLEVVRQEEYRKSFPGQALAVLEQHFQSQGVSGFHPDSQWSQAIRDIGIRLNDIGGGPLMLQVWDSFNESQTNEEYIDDSLNDEFDEDESPDDPDEPIDEDDQTLPIHMERPHAAAWISRLWNGVGKWVT